MTTPPGTPESFSGGAGAPAPLHGDGDRAATAPAPGRGDATRATVGVVVAWAAGILVAGLVGLMTDPEAGQFRSAGSTRAQLAVQAVIFALLAMLLIESLRLSERPGARPRDPLANPAREPRPRPAVGVILVVGAIAGMLAQLAGPIVGALLPGLHDPNPPVDGLGIGSGTAADLGTVLVVAGLVPLGEELLFRGVLAGAWMRAGRPAVAVATSAVLFGLAHVTVGPRSIVVDLLLGALLAGALLWSGSLGAPVLAHCSINAIALLDAGVKGALPVVLLVVVVIATTVAATKLSPLVSWPPPGDTLPE